MNWPPKRLPSKESRGERVARVVFFGAVAIAAVIVAWGVFLFSSKSDDLSALGQFFGGTVAPALSLAVLSMLYLAYRAQQRQAAGQQDQLDVQRDQITAANRRADREAFERTFYHLLTMLREVVNAMQTRPAGPRGDEYHGVEAFREAVHELEGRCLEVPGVRRSDESPVSSLPAFKALLERPVRDSCFADGCDFSHYIRTLHYLLWYIDDSDSDNALVFAQLVRAQMSIHEVTLAFYVALTPYGMELQAYLEKYRMLWDLRQHKDLRGFRAFYTTALSFTP